jgi:hypothetical protein
MIRFGRGIARKRKRYVLRGRMQMLRARQGERIKVRGKEKTNIL